MKESFLTKIISNDDIPLEVDWYNARTEKFILLMQFWTTPDLVRQMLERRGIDDENLVPKIATLLLIDETLLKPSAAENERYAKIHEGYKTLMRKAINKEPFLDEELYILRLMLSKPPIVTVNIENGKLLVSENPEFLILQRLGRGIVDVFNGDKDIRICAASDCDVAFVPKRKNHKYHSRSCANRTYKRLERSKE